MMPMNVYVNNYTMNELPNAVKYKVVYDGPISLVPLSPSYASLLVNE